MGLIKMFAAAALGVAVLVGQPSPAEAAVRLANGASASATINCSQSMGWVRTTVNLQPRSNLSKQTVAFRQFIAPIDGSIASVDGSVDSAAGRSTGGSAARLRRTAPSAGFAPRHEGGVVRRKRWGSRSR